MELKTKQYEEDMEIETGFYYLNMPNEIYHHLSGSVSKSGLDIFHDDPYKFYHRKEKSQTRAMQLGSAIHAACLEPGVFERDYVLLPDVKDRRQPEYKQAVKSLGEGHVFTNADVDKIKGMQAAVHDNVEAHKLLSAQGYTEISGLSVDENTGLVIRHRFDKLAFIDGKWWAVDIKKTKGADEYSFSKSIWDYRYHVQQAVYSKGFEEITGEKLAGFKFIAVEDEYPHKVSIYELCDMSQKIGSDEARMDIDLLAEYEKGNMTAHNNEPSKIISLPEFVMRQFEEEII